MSADPPRHGCGQPFLAPDSFKLLTCGENGHVCELCKLLGDTGPAAPAAPPRYGCGREFYAPPLNDPLTCGPARMCPECSARLAPRHTFFQRLRQWLGFDTRYTAQASHSDPAPGGGAKPQPPAAIRRSRRCP